MCLPNSSPEPNQHNAVHRVHPTGVIVHVYQPIHDFKETKLLEQCGAVRNSTFKTRCLMEANQKGKQRGKESDKYWLSDTIFI